MRPRKVAILCSALVAISIAGIAVFTKDKGRYRLEHRYESKNVSVAVVCRLKGMTVEQRVISEVGIFGHGKLCVERHAASLDMTPKYAAIRYDSRAGYVVNLYFSEADAQRIDRTFRSGRDRDVSMYVDGVSIRRFYATDGSFDGVFMLWVSSREEAETLMDTLIIDGAKTGSAN